MNQAVVMGADTVTGDLRLTIAQLGLAGSAVCVHSAMRSFGRLAGGAPSFVNAFLAEGCTLLVPTFSWAAFAVAPPEGMRPEQNGIDYSWPFPDGNRNVFNTSCVEVDSDAMGAIPSHVVQRDDRSRGDHPLVSFTAVGDLAKQLIVGQSPHDPFAPLRALASIDGRVLLAGVGLNRMTSLHLSETDAGRRPFARWALDQHGAPSMVEVGGCSEGFAALEPALSPLMHETNVGSSRWRVYDAATTCSTATHAIVEQSNITHCGDPACRRCADAIQGGPIR